MTVRDINRVTEVAICLTNLALLVQLKTSDLSDTDKALACMANLVVSGRRCAGTIFFSWLTQRCRSHQRPVCWRIISPTMSATVSGR